MLARECLIECTVTPQSMLRSDVENGQVDAVRLQADFLIAFTIQVSVGLPEHSQNKIIRP